MCEKSATLVNNFAVIFNILLWDFHLLKKFILSPERIVDLMNQEADILHLDPSRGIFIVGCPLLEELLKMQAVYETGVLLVGRAEALKNESNEKIEHEKLYHNDEKCKVNEGNVGAALFWAVYLELLPALEFHASLSIDRAIFGEPPELFVRMDCKLSHDDVPVFSRSTSD